MAFPLLADPKTESRLPLLGLDIYVPRDERFGHLKMSDFLGYSLKSLALSFIPTIHAILDESPNEFDSFEDVMRLYEGGLPIPKIPLLDFIHENDPFKFIKAIFSPSDGQQLLKFPLPEILKGVYPC